MDFTPSFGMFNSMNIANILYSTAGFIMLASFLARDILWLRTIFMCAAILNGLSGAIIGLYSVIVWDIGFCVIHLVHVVWLLIERKPFFLPNELKPIYEKHFSNLTPGEFKRLWKSGEAIKGDQLRLCTEGEAAEKLLFMFKGSAVVSKSDKEIATINQGSFIGEMSFLTGDKVSADVTTKTNVSCMSWSQDELHKLKSSRPKIHTKLIAILGVDLVHKLKSQNAKNN